MTTKRSIACVLRNIGTAKCVKKAEALEQEGTLSSLHFRGLDLNVSHVQAIAHCLSQEQEGKGGYSSISFSYNVIGDLGATALAKHLPKSVSEIGLVGCGIGDAGGAELLKWMKNAPALRMACIEQNHFSEALRREFKAFSKEHPQILVVV